MACSRLKVPPKITSHRTGWSARVKTSVRSWRSFCSSTRQNVATRSGNSRQIGGYAGVTLANAPGRPPCAAGLAQAALALDPAVEVVAGVVAEDVLEGRVG